MSETALLLPGLAAFAAATVRAWSRTPGGAPPRDLPWWWLLGAGLIALVIAERWMRLGYGPFSTLYEVLLSNLFSLGLLYAIAYLLVPRIREGAPVAAAVFAVMAVWAAWVPREATFLPVTYENPWLWVHVTVGKFFLAASLIAASLALAVNVGLAPGPGQRAPDAAAAEQTAWRFLALAFVFHSLMLIAGAAWAQDAWGRFWAWDPLETWSFLTWLTMALALHWRVTRPGHPLQRWLPVLVFVIAFITFFGVPFVSEAPHKGRL
jgi:ABC-type transport system involved in cytochrome c biogenesis permease subunit